MLQRCFLKHKKELKEKYKRGNIINVKLAATRCTILY